MLYYKFFKNKNDNSSKKRYLTQNPLRTVLVY